MYDKIKVLRELNSRAEKIRILQTFTPLEIEVLKYTYDPQYVYFNKFSSIDEDNIKPPTQEFVDFLKGFSEYPSVPNLYLERKVEQFGDLLKLVVNKNFMAGINVTTINNALGNIIATFDCMLAADLPANGLDDYTRAEIKYDGVRVIAKIELGQIRLYTRNGKRIFCKHITDELLNLIADGEIFDGELICNEGKSKDRTSISGIVNSAVKTGRDIIEEEVSYVLFDRLESIKSNVPYDTRRKELEECYSRAGYLKYIKLAPKVNVTGVTQIRQLFDFYIRDGYEGLILKKANGVYEYKRSHNWVKVKEVNTADLLCVGVSNGAPLSKYEDMIGNLTVKGTVKGKDITVNVGSGLSDELRGQRPDYFLGKTIEVKYNQLVFNKDSNTWSLFLPRFVCVREDK